MVAWAGNTLNAHSVSVVGQFDQQAAGMIADLSIGVRDLERSKGFYDSALAPLGYRCLRPGRTMLGYGYGFLDVATCRIKFAEVSSPAILIRPSSRAFG